MSSGIVICSECRREVHQYGPKTWEHCEDRSQACDGATPVYPASTDEIAGQWCGRDGGILDHPGDLVLMPDETYVAHQTAMLQKIADVAGIPVEQLVSDPRSQDGIATLIVDGVPSVIAVASSEGDKPWRAPKQRTNRKPDPKRHQRRRLASASRKANR